MLLDAVEEELVGIPQLTKMLLKEEIRLYRWAAANADSVRVIMNMAAINMKGFDDVVGDYFNRHHRNKRTCDRCGSLFYAKQRNKGCIGSGCILDLLILAKEILHVIGRAPSSRLEVLCKAGYQRVDALPIVHDAQYGLFEPTLFVVAGIQVLYIAQPVIRIKFRGA